ncbi:MAG: hypothetical protein KAK04_03300, partial [Cyclobacteriaceae bacterium]|nr:hypothetical protein [Cyclobacteriaceae bacterium]
SLPCRQTGETPAYRRQACDSRSLVKDTSILHTCVSFHQTPMHRGDGVVERCVIYRPHQVD